MLNSRAPAKDVEPNQQDRADRCNKYCKKSKNWTEAHLSMVPTAQRYPWHALVRLICRPASRRLSLRQPLGAADCMCS
jgi:hypothetical protein